ncbi:MAG: phage tail tape measure protein [Gammaproteobacteria bacterium]|nr:phage tail tape measure protein [Gammaproteobacteria bacterium]
MSKEFAFSVVIGAALAGSFNFVLGGNVKQIDRLGETIKRVQSQSDHIKTFRRLKTELADTDQAHQAAKERVAQLTQEMRRAEKPTQAMHRELGRAKREANKLNQALADQRDALVRQRKAMRDAGVATAGLGDQERRLGATVARLRERYDALGSAIQRRDAVLAKRQAMRGQLLDAVALGAAITAPIKAAIRFESVMADVKKVVDFESPTQFRTMERDILQLSTVIPMSAQGLGEIVAAAGQAGIARHELTRFATDAAKMGVAFDLSSEQAGSTMTGRRSIFKLKQDQVVSLGDS